MDIYLEADILVKPIHSVAACSTVNVEGDLILSGYLLIYSMTSTNL